MRNKKKRLEKGYLTIWRHQSCCTKTLQSFLFWALLSVLGPLHSLFPRDGHAPRLWAHSLRPFRRSMDHRAHFAHSVCFSSFSQEEICLYAGEHTYVFNWSFINLKSPFKMAESHLEIKPYVQLFIYYVWKKFKQWNFVP